MKEIIQTITEPAVITIADVRHIKPEKRYVGFMHNSSGGKGWLQAMEYNQDLYQIFSVREGVSIGNHWGNNPMPFERTINFLWDSVLNKSRGAKVFLFDTPQELFKWLSE